MNTDLIMEKDAAEYLGISLSTLKRKRYGREIGCYLVGTGIRYSREKHLDKFLESCEKKAIQRSVDTGH